jgi:hypothetical protein
MPQQGWGAGPKRFEASLSRVATLSGGMLAVLAFGWILWGLIWGDGAGLPLWLKLPIGLGLGWFIAKLIAQIARLSRSDRPTLVIDREGLDHVLYGRIPWDRIVGMKQLVTQAGKPPQRAVRSLVLGVTRPGDFLAAQPDPFGLATGSRAAIGDISIPLDGYNRTPGQIEAAARAWRDTVDPPLAASWQPGMSEEHALAQLRLESAETALAAHLSTPLPAAQVARDQDVAQVRRLAAATRRGEQAVARAQLRDKARTTWKTVAVLLFVLVPAVLYYLHVISIDDGLGH